LVRFMTYLVFGDIPSGMDVFVHPVALAGWVGLFVTALNLSPVGQLAGGRMAYALFGSAHRFVSIGTFFSLLTLGAVAQSLNWIVFAGLVFLLIGFHHAPPLDDVTPLSRERYAVGVFCLLLLVLLIPAVPRALPESPPLAPPRVMPAPIARPRPCLGRGFPAKIAALRTERRRMCLCGDDDRGARAG